MKQSEITHLTGKREYDSVAFVLGLFLFSPYQDYIWEQFTKYGVKKTIINLNIA